jgi:hypothetical protein
VSTATSLDVTHAVAPAYHHEPKHARPAPSIALGEAVLKWYDVALPDDPVPAEMRALARRSLAEATLLGELRIGDGLGFVMLHRCGRMGFHFLIVLTWRNDNELWQTVWAKEDDDDPDFHPWRVESTHRPTFCVWELGAVEHERLAWTTYLRSSRDEAARRTYLADVFEGAV